MSVRIGAALQRELPAVEELRAREPAIPDAQGEELALRLPVPALGGARPKVALTAPVPAAPDHRALASLAAVGARLREPGALDGLGASAAPVRGMLDAVEEVLRLTRAVERSRSQGGPA